MNQDSYEESFQTRLGPMIANWENGALTSLVFAETEPTLPTSDSHFAQTVQAHFEGQSKDFRDVPLALSTSTPFAREVYRQARLVPSGETTTYGELAAALGKPGSARAVGTALGNNPILLLVPCHRVLGVGQRIGGFSAPGGAETKSLMLASEGYATESIWDPMALDSAYAQLKRCPKLGPYVERIGPCTMTPLYPERPFGALARAVLYQQLATAAARTIEQRVKNLGSTPFPTAQEIAALSETQLRQAGVSGPKIATLKRLAAATLDGSLEPEKLRLLPNHVVEQQVSSIKGLGTWSARMFLMSHLGRRDILPVKDLGIRKGFQLVYGLRALPNEKFMERKAKAWRPYRSVASWYLWRSLESGVLS